MAPWLLLVLTIACALLTGDAFRLRGAMKEAPYRFLPRDLKCGMDHLPLAEQDQLQRLTHSPTGEGALAWLFLAMTVLLGILTVKAFVA
jgi:hypothetical protein